MKKLIVVLLFVMFLFPSIYSKKLCKLTDLLEARSIAVNKNIVFISGENSIHMYSLKDFKLLKKIGRKGNGPGEFNISPRIRIYNDKLYTISHFNRVYVIDMKGEFLVEKKTEGFINLLIAPVGKNFVLYRFIMKKVKNKMKTGIAILLLDGNLKKIKDFSFKSSDPKDKIRPVSYKSMFDIWNNKIYIADSSKGLYVEVFDSQGKKLKEFKSDYKKIKVSDSFKKQSMEDFKKQNPRMIKKEFEYPEYFPAFSHFYIFNGKLYFKTYEKKGNDILFRIFDTNGKELKSVFLPKSDIFTIDNDVYYYIDSDENEDLVVYSKKI